MKLALAPADWPRVVGKALEALQRATDDEEAILIALRRYKQERVSQIRARDLAGALDLDAVSRSLSDLADELLARVLSQVSERMGLSPQSPVGVLGYGKLGSREMSYASDTDIVFVYDAGAGVPETALTRLAVTANRWLTAHTAAGTLYETDFRLRPYGNSGLLITPFSGFREYQRDKAWVWEHQALTRARWIAGPPPLGGAFAELRREILTRPRDLPRLRAEVLAMRARIFAAAPRPADHFDVKHSRGGVIDVEFLVQHLILAHAAHHPALADVPDNGGALALGAALGLLPGDHAARVAEAYRCYRQWMHRERLRGSEQVHVSLGEAEAHRAAVLALWKHLFPSESSPS